MGLLGVGSISDRKEGSEEPQDDWGDLDVGGLLGLTTWTEKSTSQL